MSQPLLLDDVTCPRCDSPLVSIDAAAADDAVTRIKLRNAGWWVRWVGGLSFIVVATTALYIARLVRDGGSVEQWMSGVEGLMKIALIVVPMVIFVARGWYGVHTNRTGRLATCHACGHRWPLF